MLKERATPYKKCPADVIFIAFGIKNISELVTRTAPCFTPQILDAFVKREDTWERDFRTRKRFMGKDISEKLHVGDIICVLLGCPVLMVLCGAGMHYEFNRSGCVD